MVKYVSNKRRAPSWLGFLAAILYIVILGLVIFGLVEIVKGLMAWAFLAFGISLVIILGLFILSNTFAWCSECRLEKKNNKLIYYYDDVVAGMGGKTTTYTFKTVTNVARLSGTKLKVEGDIIVKAPMSKSKSIKYTTLSYFSDEMYEMFKNFKEDIE